MSYSVITMGNFDGVHLGHQKLLKEVVKRAKAAAGQAVVITYTSHPLYTLKLVAPPYLLTTFKERERFIRSLGIEQLVYLDFTEDLAKTEPYDFLSEFLIKRLHAKEIVFGYDANFGRDRRGDFAFLQAQQSHFGYKADIVSPCEIEGQIVSSGAIRQFLLAGEPEKANLFLGRPYSVDGQVQEGEKIGRKLGFPTINIVCGNEDKIIPANGVYLTQTTIGENTYYSLTDIGVSPTVKHLSYPLMESFILDYTGDLYGYQVNTAFLKKIRDEKKFASLNELTKAIEADVATARAFIGK